MDAMLDCVSCEPERRFRFGYGHGPGVSVYGWPSQGGIYTLHGCMGVELDFLGYDRFDLPLDLVEPQPAEDEHCNRMRRLGATWWTSYHEMVEYDIRGPQNTDDFLQVGWPESGGVWVLQGTIEEARRKGAGLVSNAYTMQERCMMIERLGGTFYANPEDCPYLDLPATGALLDTLAKAEE
ncbi:hypothetical protein PDE_05080 [Penicillium oxalicum 114-2]|uniref:Uncharacterized protein n=1 Tax=Penicillium oxalicum (strain 114-2 / CGMCC 5302) TaxID=933388 RepID=S7ZHI7_PENO1|nr:hypothetical protein PDE_05080 [Penicillium oxalicum 114-2]